MRLRRTRVGGSPASRAVQLSRARQQQQQQDQRWLLEQLQQLQQGGGGEPVAELLPEMVLRFLQDDAP